MTNASSGWAKVIEKAGAKGFHINLPNEGEPTEFVLVAGWWGAKLRHVLKYSTMVREIRPSAATITCVPSSMWSLMTSYATIAKRAKAVLSDVSEVTPGIDLWLYYFSNGGLMMHTELMGYLGNKDSEKVIDVNLKGLMLDSCPAYWTPRSVTRALNDGKDNAAFYCIMSAVAPILSLFGDKDAWWKSVLNSDLHVPELYLYSGGDQVTIAEKVKELIDMRKENGIDASEHVFDDSPHVSHYMKHRDEYTKALEDFMKSNS